MAQQLLTIQFNEKVNLIIDESGQINNKIVR
jgi:hypothetical protein